MGSVAFTVKVTGSHRHLSMSGTRSKFALEVTPPLWSPPHAEGRAGSSKGPVQNYHHTQMTGWGLGHGLPAVKGQKWQIPREPQGRPRQDLLLGWIKGVRARRCWRTEQGGVDTRWGGTRWGSRGLL